MQIATIVLALGANRPGPWGSPRATLLRAYEEIGKLGATISSCSEIISTQPFGPGWQPRYHNSVLRLVGFVPLMRFLHGLKTIERRAGRKSRPRWSERELDIDIICVGGRLVPYRRARTGLVGRGSALHVPGVARLRRPGQHGTQTGRVQLPHPEMHRRSFVLGPMAQVAPHWRHPSTGLTVRQMLLQLGGRRPRKLPTSKRLARFARGKMV